MIVPAFRSADRGLGGRAGDIVRGRVAGAFSKNELRVISNGDVDDWLRRSGFEENVALSEGELRELAKKFRADERIVGTVTRTQARFASRRRWASFAMLGFRNRSPARARRSTRRPISSRARRSPRARSSFRCGSVRILRAKERPRKRPRPRPPVSSPTRARFRRESVCSTRSSSSDPSPIRS